MFQVQEERLNHFLKSEVMAISPRLNNSFTQRSTEIYSLLVDKNTINECFLQQVNLVALEIFRKIQHEAAKDQLTYSFSKNRVNNSQNYTFSPNFDSVFSHPHIPQIIQKAFLTLFNIDMKIESEAWHLSWSKNNRSVCFKPTYESPYDLNAEHKARLIAIYLDETSKDVSFIVGKGEKREVVRGHKAFLSTYTYFKKLFQNKENDTSITTQADFYTTLRASQENLNTDKPIAKEKEYIFENIEPEVFKAMLYFAYTYELPFEVKNDVKTLFKIFNFAYDLKFNVLRETCKSLVYQRIDEKHFLYFIFSEKEHSDDDFYALCKWFLIKYPHYENTFNMEHFTSLQALETYCCLRNYGSQKLNLKCMDILNKRLNLNSDLNYLLLSLKNFNSEQLRIWHDNLLKKIDS